MRRLRAVLILPCMLTAMLAAIPILLTIPRTRRTGFKRRLTRLGLRMVGIKPRIIGTLHPGPSLVVSNHVSYFDILLLQQLGDLRFTPKQEIAGWPVIGTITTAFGSVYIDRHPRRARDMVQQVRKALAAGDRVSLFPEGTTGEGTHLLPFRPALLTAAEAAEGEPSVTVQPVAVRYRRADGGALRKTDWPYVAWYGDMSLVPHLWYALRGLALRAEIVCLPPVDTAGKDRRQIAEDCRGAIASALE